MNQNSPLTATAWFVGWLRLVHVYEFGETSEKRHLRGSAKTSSRLHTAPASRIEPLRWRKGLETVRGTEHTDVLHQTHFTKNVKGEYVLLHMRVMYKPLLTIYTRDPHPH